MKDTTINQKCPGAGKKRTENRNPRERKEDANAPCLGARRERGDNVVAHR